jgi:hypothetical protein
MRVGNPGRGYFYDRAGSAPFAAFDFRRSQGAQGEQGEQGEQGDKIEPVTGWAGRFGE